MRIRKKIYGLPDAPRLCVFVSNRHIYAQIIDDTVGRTLVAASTMSKELRGSLQKMANKEAAAKVGNLIARKAIEKGIKRVVFDRNYYLFHGKVKALADSAREVGLQF
jgi:large subunit ribosomal protein L18